MVDEPVEETVEILLTVLATMEWAVLVGMEEHLNGQGKCLLEMFIVLLIHLFSDMDLGFCLIVTRDRTLAIGHG
jgi:hypothetical protein